MNSRVETYLRAYMPYAIRTQQDTGFNAMALLTQSALETGYGSGKPGNMMFGIKADSSWKGAKQLLKTREVFPASKRESYRQFYSTGGRELLEIQENYKTIEGVTYDLFIVKTWFRAYKSPYDSFVDYTKFIQQNSRYKKALSVKSNASDYLKAVANAKYATGPNYQQSLLDTMNSIRPLFNNLYTEMSEEAKKKIRWWPWLVGAGIVTGIILFTE
jgi:flagellar protein FlgJ